MSQPVVNRDSIIGESSVTIAANQSTAAQDFSEMKRMVDGVSAIRPRIVNAFLMDTREALIVTPDFPNSADATLALDAGARLPNGKPVFQSGQNIPALEGIILGIEALARAANHARVGRQRS